MKQKRQLAKFLAEELGHTEEEIRKLLIEFEEANEVNKKSTKQLLIISLGN